VKERKIRQPRRTYTISQLRLEFGVTARALRFYEEKGLLSPIHMATGRVYSYRERARLTLILRGRRVGLSISEIREILDAYREGADVQNAKALAIFGRRMEALELERLEVEAALTALRTASGRLLPHGPSVSR
jgi:DNA-binding transcriptional MerR regulator